jgi:hypothetical protein
MVGTSAHGSFVHEGWDLQKASFGVVLAVPRDLGHDLGMTVVVKVAPHHPKGLPQLLWMGDRSVVLTVLVVLTLPIVGALVHQSR